jgi:hypothetical protein
MLWAGALQARCERQSLSIAANRFRGKNRQKPSPSVAVASPGLATGPSPESKM